MLGEMVGSANETALPALPAGDQEGAWGTNQETLVPR
jgi:hypothetical protein